MKVNLKGLLISCSAFFALNLNAQSGSSCSDPVLVTGDQCFNHEAINAGQRWYAFTAANDAEVIKIINSSDPAQKHIHKIYVYDGCGQLLRSDQMESGTDEQLDLILFALIPGHQYTVQIVNDENPGCSKCGIDNNSFFDICFSSAPSQTLSGCSSAYCSDPCDNENLFNGGFEQGLVGFGSTATYHPCSQITQPPPYVYGVCSDASQLNGSWNGLPFNGTSAFFVDDPETPPPGNTVSINAAAWYTTIPVVRYQMYCISFWTRSIADATAASLDPVVVLNVDGNITPDQYNVATSGALPEEGVWQQVCYSWYSNDNTSLSVWIGSVPNGSGSTGNDYALDDISIKGYSAAPTITASSTISCVNFPALLIANTTAQPPNVSYLWMPGGFTTQSISVNPQVATTYTLSVTDGCAHTFTTTITITPVDALPSFTYAL